MSQSAHSIYKPKQKEVIRNLLEDSYRKQILTIFQNVKIMNECYIPQDVAEIITYYYCLRTKDEIDLSWKASQNGIYFHYKKRSDGLVKDGITRDNVMDIAYRLSDILKAMAKGDIFNHCTYQ